MATVRTRLGPVDHGREMTLEEFREAEDEPGYRYERARGVIEVVEIPPDDHARVVDNVHKCISLYRQQHPGQIVRIGHGIEVRLISAGLRSDRCPDLGVVFRNAAMDSRGRCLSGLVVEVVSTG